MANNLPKSNAYKVEQGDAGIGAIISAWIEFNKDQVGKGKTFANRKEVEKWFYDNNTFRHPITGKPCKFGELPKSGPLLKPNDIIKTPEGNPIQKVLKEIECKIEPEKFELTTPPPMSRIPLEGSIVLPAAPPPAPEAPAQQVGVRLPIFPTQGNLANGATGGIYNAVNKLTYLLGDKPQLPHTAARGSSPYGVGIQALFPDLPRAVSQVLPWAPIPFTAGAYQGVVAPIGLDTNTKGSWDRVAHAREGGNGSSQEGREKDGGLNLSPVVTDKTKYDATRLWGLNYFHDTNGQLRDIANDPYKDNAFYVIRGEGADVPSITLNERYVTTGKHSDFLQATPSGPQAVPLNNYAAAAMVDAKYIIPRLNTLNAEFGQKPTIENVQELIGLYNLRSNLTGISNYPVNADVSRELSPDAQKRLNPAEQIAYNKARLLEHAASKDINVSELNLNARADARTISKAQLHTNMIDYYTEVAKVKESAFRDIYKHYVKGDAEFKVDDEASRRAAATKFVESLPYFQSYPEKGHSLASEEYLFLSPREKFNLVEKFEYQPKTMPKSAAALKGAMDAIAESPENIQAVLRAAGEDPQVMQAIGKRDDLSVQLTKWHGDKNMPFNRDAAIAAIKARGYSDGVMDTQFHGDFTNGILRRPADMMQDLAKSADDLGIVAQRSRDFRQMVTDGEKDSPIAPGAHANALLYALAQEKDNKTLLKIEENIRKTAKTSAEADQKIEALRQGVAWAKDHVSAIHFNGKTHTDVGRSVATASMRAVDAKKAKELANPALGVDHVAMVRETDPATRDTAMAAAQFQSPTTRPLAVTAMDAANATVVPSAVVETLQKNPEMRATYFAQLRELGKKNGSLIDGMLSRTPQHLLAYNMEQLLAAQDALAKNPNDAEAKAKIDYFSPLVLGQFGGAQNVNPADVQKLQAAERALAMNPNDTQALTDIAILNAKISSQIMGGTTVVAPGYVQNTQGTAAATRGAVSTAFDGKVAGAAAEVGSVLAAAVVTTAGGKATGLLSGKPGDATLGNATTIIATHDHTNAAGNAAVANSTIAAAATTDGLIVPVVPLVRRKPEVQPQAPAEPIRKIDPLPNCGVDVTPCDPLPSPVNPGLPGTMPPANPGGPTPPVVQPPAPPSVTLPPCAPGSLQCISVPPGGEIPVLPPVNPAPVPAPAPSVGG